MFLKYLTILQVRSTKSLSNFGSCDEQVFGTLLPVGVDEPLVAPSRTAPRIEAPTWIV